VRSAWPENPVFAGMLRAESAVPGAAPSWGSHPLLKLRGAASARLNALFPGYAALANALLLGRRETLDPAIRERFARAGLVHLLAISGTHVGILAGIVLLLGRAFGVGRQTLAWSTMALLAIYLALIGAPPSAVRAGVMLALALLGLALQRPASPFPVVAAAAGVLLVADPMVALNPGFQLSFAGVLGILLLRRALLRVVPTAWRRRALPRYTIDLAAASVAAFAATAPIAAYHFGQVAPIALVANLPAVPLTGVALACIAGAALTDPILPPLAHVFAWFGDHALGMLDAVATRAAEAPLAGMGIARPGWGWIVVALLAGCFVLEAARRMRGPIRWGAAAALALAVLLAMPGVAAAPGRALELHFIDVGQGDAVAIRTPAGRWLLIDAGPRTDRFDAGRSRVLPFLRAHGAERLEALILTHPDGDHLGGAAAVLDGISVGRLLEPGQAVGKPLYLATLREAEQRGVPWAAARAGRRLRIDGLELEVLAPTERLVEEAAESNEVSVVTLLRYGSFRALLTGDLPDDGEQRLVASHPDLRVQVLKAGHHGSRTSTSAALLDATRPEVVVITVGRRNRYGHPAPSVLWRIRERGIPILRTDLGGTVSLRAQEDGSWEEVRP
jgi:competence protein ComEC